MRRDEPDIDQFSLFMERHPQQGHRVLELNREGQDLLDSGKLKKAERKFREATQICECAIPALNNLALCAQLRGDTKRAIRAANQALEFHPTNVFAHCTLVECYEELGRSEKAHSHAERAITLLENPDVPLDVLPKVIEALAQLQWDERITEIYRSYCEGIGFEDALDGVSWFHLGVAAANLGRMDEAIAHWRQAQKKDPGMELADLYASALSLIQEGKVPPFRFSNRLERDEKPLDPKRPSEGLKPVVAKGIWNEKEDDDHRHALVDLLGMWEEPWAEEFLRLMLIQPDLPDDLKGHAAIALIERGAIGEDEEIEMFIDGMKRTVVVNQKEVPSPPPAAVEQFELGLARRRAGNITAAEKAYRAALKIDPNFGEVMVNLANICRSTDRSEEGALLLEKAVALTGSPTAILNLAAVYLVEEERVEEGRDLISAVPIEDVDTDLLPLYYRTLGQLHMFDWDFQAAREAFTKLIALQPDNEDTKGLLDWVTTSEAMRDNDLALENKRRARYLRQLVDPQMPLVMALRNLTKDNLIGITYWHELSYGIMRKAEIAQMIANHLQDPKENIWEEISDEAMDVLAFLRSVGGSAPLAKLEEMFGSTEDDSISWKDYFPDSAIGELQTIGIVFVGQDEDKETIAFIPKELLARLAREV